MSQNSARKRKCQNPVPVHTASNFQPTESKRQRPVNVAFSLSSAQSTTSKITESQFVHQVVCMLAEDMQLMAMVERTGFKKLCKAVLPQYSLPSRRTVGRHLNEMYKA